MLLHCVKEALALAERIQHIRWIKFCISFGYLYSLRMGNNDRALDYAKQALESYRQINDYLGEALTLKVFGNIYGDFHDEARAEEYFKESMEIAEREGLRSELITFDITLGNFTMISAAMKRRWCSIIKKSTQAEQRGRR